MTPETAQARRLYLHVANGGALTDRDMGRVVEWMEAKDAEIAALRAKLARAVEAFGRIGRWELPETGEFWESGRPVSYEAKFGSQGAKRYIEGFVRATLADLATDTGGGKDKEGGE